MDEGLAHERSKAIVRKLVGADPDPLRLVRLEGEALARRPEGLADEAYAVSMFGGSRAIWIDAQGRDLLPALEPLFARPPAECAIVIKAAQLKKGHALRAAFEKAANAASIECYADEPKALGRADRQRDPQRRPHDRARRAGGAGRTSSAPTGKRAGPRSPSSFSTPGDRSRIELADVRAIVSDAAPSPLDGLVDQALAGDLQRAVDSAARYFRRRRRRRPADRPGWWRV